MRNLTFYLLTYAPRGKHHRPQWCFLNESATSHTASQIQFQQAITYIDISHIHFSIPEKSQTRRRDGGKG